MTATASKATLWHFIPCRNLCCRIAKLSSLPFKVSCRQRARDLNAAALWNLLYLECTKSPGSSCHLIATIRDCHFARCRLHLFFQTVFFEYLTISFSTPDWSLDPSNLRLIYHDCDFILVTTAVVFVVVIFGVLVECRVLLFPAEKLTPSTVSGYDCSVITV